jgi:predicted regulator of Ras-like GTPase activity (Roadblock/LC7/MglB family)
VLALPAMDAAQALADLTEISSQIEGAVIAEAGGRLVASTFPDDSRGERVAGAVLELLRAADETPGESRPVTLSQLEAAMPSGSVFVVRDDRHVIAAVTGAQPTVGLIFYDLKTCLRLIEEAKRSQPKKSSARASKRTAGQKKADA